MSPEKPPARRVPLRPTCPPPNPSVSAQFRSTESAFPNDVIFTNGLIRFLIVNLSLLAVLLAVNILVVIRADSIQVARNPENSKPTSSDFRNENPEINLRKKTLPDSFSDHSETGNAVGRDHSIVTLAEFEGEETGTNLVFTNSTPALLKSVTSTDSPAKKPDEFQVADISGNQSDTETEVLVVTELAPYSNPLDEEQSNLSFKEPTTPEICAPAAGIDEAQPNPQMAAPFYGTKIKWVRVAKNACRTAKSQDKLLFLMHVSGNFTKEEFT